MTVVAEYTHGTESAYTSYRCRCGACRSAAGQAAMQRKAERLTKPTPDRVHGTANGYQGYNCRCDACRDAWVVYTREKRGAKASRLAAENASLRALVGQISERAARGRRQTRAALRDIQSLIEAHS